MKANKKSPPAARANIGAAIFPAGLAATILSHPTKTVAPKPSKTTIRKNAPINQVEYTTDFRAVTASFTVKKRMSKWGNPATPNTSAILRDNMSNPFVYLFPGFPNPAPKGTCCFNLLKHVNNTEIKFGKY